MFRTREFYLVLGAIFCGLAPVFGAPSTQESAGQVSAGILSSDSRITSIQTKYTVDVGVVAGKPTVTMTGIWVAEGRKELHEKDLNGIAEVNAFDGTVTRTLSNPQDPAKVKTGMIRPTERAAFALKNALPNGYTGRNVWEHELIPLLESGRATVSPSLVSYEQHSCYEITGQAMVKSLDGKDGAWFKLLLDPAFGYMPRYLEEFLLDEKGAVTSRIVMDQYVLTEVARNTWFPTSLAQKVFVRGQSGELSLRTMNNIRLSDVIVNKDIPDDRFVLQFPVGTKVADFVLGKSSREPLMSIAGSEARNEESFRRLLGEVTTARDNGPFQSSSRLRAVGLISLGAVVLIIVTTLLRRRLVKP